MNYTTSDYLTQLETDRQDLVDNLETKGITGLTGDETFTELVPEVLNIPSGGGTTEPEEKDVNFYDYDGTRVYSYTKTEFLNLSTMPNPIDHGDGNQKWNWDLSDAKTYVTTYGILNIGQTYDSENAIVKIHIDLEDGRLSPYLGFAVNGTATVDWGDNTTSTVTGTSISTVVYTQHNYSKKGNYIIKVISQSKIYLSGGYQYDSQGSYLLSANSTLGEAHAYRYCIKQIELSENIYLGNGSFTNCRALTNLVVPKEVRINNYAIFKSCYSLKRVMLPSNIGIILYDNSFNFCYNLTDVVIPSSVQYLNTSSFSNCQANTKFIIPATVSSIQASVFANCLFAVCFDFSNHASIPALSSANVFSGIALSQAKIIVPDDLYEDWIVANIWSTYASYIIKKTDWDALQ